MIYIKNIVNEDIYPVQRRIDKVTYIVKIGESLVWVQCLATTPYEVVKI